METAARLRAQVAAVVRLRMQIEFFWGVKRLLSTWRLGHSLLGVFLVPVLLL